MPSQKQESLPLDLEHPAAKVLIALGFAFLEHDTWHAPGGKAAKITSVGQIEFCLTNTTTGVYLRSGSFDAANAANAYDLLNTAHLYLR